MWQRQSAGMMQNVSAGGPRGEQTIPAALGRPESGTTDGISVEYPVTTNSISSHGGLV